MLPVKCSCGGFLETAKKEALDVGVCKACGGEWVDRKAFEVILSATIREYTVPDVDQLRLKCRERLQALAQSQGALYRDCPSCGQQMARRSFTRSSGLVTHQCATDGYLFGEKNWIEDAVEFMRRGGEILVLRDDLAAKEMELQHLRAMTRQQPPGTPQGSGGAEFM